MGGRTHAGHPMAPPSHSILSLVQMQVDGTIIAVQQSSASHTVSSIGTSRTRSWFEAAVVASPWSRAVEKGIPPKYRVDYAGPRQVGIGDSATSPITGLSPPRR